MRVDQPRQQPYRHRPHNSLSRIGLVARSQAALDDLLMNLKLRLSMKFETPVISIQSEAEKYRRI